MCTGIRLIAQNDSVVCARTLEFGQDLQSNIIIIPRDYTFVGTTSFKKQEGLRWKSKYAAAGANALGVVALVDGVNETGLAGGLFYFPHYAQYQEITQEQAAQSIAPWELLTWLLTNFSTVDQVKKALATIFVSNTVFGPWGIVLPIHVVIHDPSGHSVVIEYTKGNLIVHDNPLGVVTNAPTFDWHITNLNNYITLSAVNSEKKQLDGITLTPLGQGSGMLGLPGDFTSPSRFVRAVAFSQSVTNINTEDEARTAAFHILNLFNIPLGVVREKENNHTYCDYTQWTSATDLHNKRYYWHVYNNRQIYMIDLMKTESKNQKAIILPMQHKSTITDATKQ